MQAANYLSCRSTTRYVSQSHVLTNLISMLMYLFPLMMQIMKFVSMCHFVIK